MKADWTRILREIKQLANDLRPTVDTTARAVAEYEVERRRRKAKRDKGDDHK